jgi:putative ABC transport system permease protein
MKRLASMLRVAVRALSRNVLSTFLTMLGIIIGVAAVTAMVSIGTGASVQMERQVAELGQNVIIVLSGSLSRGGVFSGMGGAATLTPEDAVAVSRELDGVLYVSPEVRSAAQLTAGDANWNAIVMGESESYPNLRRWPLAEGEFFTALDVRNAARVVVLGRTTSRKLFENANPVGQTIRIKGVPFTVVGLLASKGSNMMGQDQDDVALMPFTTAMRRVFGQTNLRLINVSAAAPDRIRDVAAQITALLHQRHRIQPEQDDDFMLRTQEEINAFATSTTTIMTALLGTIAAVSLLVGGIGIMNIMLVSVTERTREIGIRLAVGARQRDIMEQFLAEALLLSLAGGVIGIGAGVGAAALVAHELHWPTLTPPYAVIGAFLFSAAVGVFFGYYPARKAARLDPIAALHFE